MDQEIKSRFAKTLLQTAKRTMSEDGSIIETYMPTDYLGSRGFEKSEFIHTECGAPLYEVKNHKKYQCGHCAKIVEIISEPNP